MKDGVKMSAYLAKCRCMHVNQVKQLIKLKENEACEESRHNNDHWCKNKKNHVTLGKDNI